MIGSHIDTVINAGQYDGCLGVISSIEVIKTLKDAGMVSARPIVAAAFTNEEGVRYSPDMMGSLVYAGGMDVEDALDAVGTDGTVLRDELKRIGYEGTVEPGFIKTICILWNCTLNRDRFLTMRHSHRRSREPSGHPLAESYDRRCCKPCRNHTNCIKT